MALFDFLKKKKVVEPEPPEPQIHESEATENKLEESKPEESKSEEDIKAQVIIPDTQELIKEDIPKALYEEPTNNEVQENSQIEATEKTGFFKKILVGLDKTRKNIMSGVDNVLKNFVKIDEELFEELEEVLIMSDIGVETSTMIIGRLRDRVKQERATEVGDVKNLLADEITKILIEDTKPFELNYPSVILVIGVNGVGKTTTIGKLAHNFKGDGKKVLVAAADTFRAAAIDQLEIWCKRTNVDVIKHQENSDPAAVVFDAVQAAKSRKTDILICDTAGRLHNKKNLMDELKKIFRIISQHYSEAHLEVLLVLDATTGQNALQQAKIFKEVANITGIVLTKLDGTAKGGIVIAIKNELKIPIYFIGVGEKADDLQEFNATEFAKALFNN